MSGLSVWVSRQPAVFKARAFSCWISAGLELLWFRMGSVSPAAAEIGSADMLSLAS